MSSSPDATGPQETLARLLARLPEMQAEAERQMLAMERCGMHVASSYWRGRLHSVRAIQALLHGDAEALVQPASHGSRSGERKETG